MKSEPSKQSHQLANGGSTMTVEDPTPDTLADALPREIARVRALQEEFKVLRAIPNVMVEPQIAIMEHEIQQAIRACAFGDVVTMLRCYATLREYDTKGISGELTRH